MPHDNVAAGVHGSSEALQPLAIAALVARSLLVGALISTAAWIIVRVLLDQLDRV